MRLKLRLFGGFRWVHSSTFVDEAGFRRVQILVFPDLGPGFGLFLAEQVRSSGSLEQFESFEVRFWWTNMGLSESKVSSVKFETVRSSLYLGSMEYLSHCFILVY